MTNTVRGQKRKINLQKRRRFYGIVALIILSIVLLTMLYSKSHTKRVCEVVNVNFNDNIVTLKHPNGLFYEVRVDDPNSYTNLLVVETVFNELKDWDTQYEVIDIK